MKGGSNVVIEPHRHPGVFIARGKEDALVTRNMAPGEAVYGEKRISVEVIIILVSCLIFTLWCMDYTEICLLYPLLSMYARKLNTLKKYVYASKYKNYVFTKIIKIHLTLEAVTICF